nr:hypothetical protein [Sicyoidochytrium minutum DNA virus]
MWVHFGWFKAWTFKATSHESTATETMAPA